MCLLIHKPRTTHFDYNDLANFYDANRDGVGIIRPEHNGEVTVKKLVAPSLGQFIDFYDDHCAGVGVVLHLRYRTHGDVNHQNTHPYPISGRHGLWLAHNGILPQGNSWDRSKSDTWHFIERIIKPLVTEFGTKVYKHPKFQAEMAKLIGPGNRFVMMAKGDPQPVIINRETGVMYKGAWMSNTYAWTPPQTIRRAAAA